MFSYKTIRYWQCLFSCLLLQDDIFSWCVVTDWRYGVKDVKPCRLVAIYLSTKLYSGTSQKT
jgi:hypothetical protein